MSISVVTPVFNESKNILKCYDRLCQQKNIDFEWVVIDDGSTDNSIEILNGIFDNHCESRFEIKIIQQVNAGAASARRNGIINSKYNLIAILDADDDISEDALQLAFEKINKDVDIVCFQVKFCLPDGAVNSMFKYTPTSWPVTGVKAFSECIDGWGLTGWFMAKRHLFVKAYEYMDSHIVGNTINGDELISRLCMFHAKNIDLCNGEYMYYLNPLSTTRRINQNYYRTVFTALALHDFVCGREDVVLLAKSHRHLLSTLWGVYCRFLKWKKQLVSPSEWWSVMQLLARVISIRYLLKERCGINKLLKIYMKVILVIYINAK